MMKFEEIECQIRADVPGARFVQSGDVLWVTVFNQRGERVTPPTRIIPAWAEVMNQKRLTDFIAVRLRSS